ncbi:hypothetical protein FRC07_014784 [Ceratobasidium sp. 392]|nr:hypothetical protein FRC07_014784 [Ceratobasidium sp. 392]
MDEDYCCVPGCDHDPFQTRKQLSAHQRHCKAAKAHEAYIATLSTARRKADEDIEPLAKRLCVAEPDTGGISTPPSPLPDPTLTPPSTSTLPAVEAHYAPAIEASRAQAPPLRLTRAQARRIDTTFRRERDALPEAPPPLPPPSADNLDNRARQAALPAQRPRVRAPFRTRQEKAPIFSQLNLAEFSSIKGFGGFGSPPLLFKNIQLYTDRGDHYLCE